MSTRENIRLIARAPFPYGPQVRHGTLLIRFLIFTFVFTFNDDTDLKIVSEYDQEIPQSQTADYPVAPRGRAAQPSRDTRKTN